MKRKLKFEHHKNCSEETQLENEIRNMQERIIKTIN